MLKENSDLKLWIYQSYENFLINVDLHIRDAHNTNVTVTGMASSRRSF